MNFNLRLLSLLFLITGLSCHFLTNPVYAQETTSPLSFCQNKLTTPSTAESTPSWIVVTTAISAGGSYAPAVKKLLNAQELENIRFLHVNTEEKISHGMMKSHQPNDFNEQVTGVEAALAFLQGKNVLAVFAGADPGVPLADALLNALNLPNNGTELTAARRDKLVMQQTLEKNGLNFIPSLASSSFSRIREWIYSGKGNRNQWPVVIKPLDSALTDGFHLCQNFEKVEQAFRSIYGTKNVFGIENKKVLAQSFMSGDEYVVNTVSHKGDALAVEVWRYHKQTVVRPDGTESRIYDYDVLLDPRTHLAQTLIRYAQDVLRALGIRHGMGHMEIIMTPHGPVLVDMGARPMGGKTELVMRDATETSPIDLAILEALRPQDFKKIIQQNPNGIIPKKNVRQVQLISRKNGIIRAIHPELIDKLPSFVKFNLSVANGDALHPTLDLATSPGSIWLLNENEEQLIQDQETIRALEDQIFEVTPDPNE